MENKRTRRVNTIIFGWLAIVGAFTFFGFGDLTLTIRLGALSLATVASLAFTVLYLFGLVWYKRLHKFSLILFFPYLFWLIYLVITILSAQAFTKNAFQNFFAYLVFGVAILYSANQRYNNPDVYYTSIRRSIVILDTITLGIFFVNFLLYGWGSDVVGSNWMIAPRSLAIFALVPLSYHLARFVIEHDFRSGWIGSLWLVAIILSLSRTALAAAVLMIGIAVLFARIKWITRIVIIAFAGLVFTVAVWLAFNTPNPLRDRFLLGDAAVQVGSVSINTSGRINIWRVVWNSAQKNLWFGRGIGSSEIIVAQQLKGLSHPHNDYLRILHDTGLFGLGIFLVQQMVWGFRLYRNSLKARYAQPETRVLMIAALLALLGMSTTFFTDNTLAYTFVLIPFGLMIGGGFILRVRR